MLPTITENDLKLINDLSSRKYSGNRMVSNATDSEIAQFKEIKAKLKTLSTYFMKKFEGEYGSLETSVSSGNPIAIGGTNLNRVWAGIFKGAKNKQYSAQVSFVMNPQLPCLDVGFYFGRASAHSFTKSEKEKLENRLNLLGASLVTEIEADASIEQRFEDLFEYGFYASSQGKKLSKQDWLKRVKQNPKNSQIVQRIYANKNGYIEEATISLSVSMIFFLMGLIPSVETENVIKKIKPLTPEERAKQAERRALIGEEGEKFVLEKEREKLLSLGIDPKIYLKHVAQESTTYGYDILSCDENKNKIFIEVKTTTRAKNDPLSCSFNISSGEVDFYKQNKTNFCLYRVYDIEGETPEIDVVDMSNVEIRANNYMIKYKI